jgi:hypothetical protein
MTGLVRKATLLCVGGLLLAGAAMAGVPSPANSTFPAHVILAGMNGPNPTGLACNNALTSNIFIIRDANNAPVVGETVTLDFVSCNPATEIVLSSYQSDASSITCATKTVTKSTDGTGTVNMLVTGGGTNPPLGNTGLKIACCKVYAGNALMTTLKVAIMDLNGVGGVAGTDAGICLSGIGYYGLSGGIDNYPRYDMDGDGDVDGTDRSRVISIIGAVDGVGGGPGSCSSSSTTSYCAP